MTAGDLALAQHHLREATTYLRGHRSVVHSLGWSRWRMTCLHRCEVIRTGSLPSEPLCSACSSLSSQAASDLTVSIVSPFPECHRVGIIHCVAFSVWLLSLNNIRLCFPGCCLLKWNIRRISTVILRNQTHFVHTSPLKHLASRRLSVAWGTLFCLSVVSWFVCCCSVYSKQ